MADLPAGVDPSVIESVMRAVGEITAVVWPDLMPEKASFAVCGYGMGQQLWPHEDGEPSHGRLAVSASLQLSTSDSYDGGDLVVAGAVMPRAPGTLVVFPGSVTHAVTEVTRGRRLALIMQSANRLDENPAVLAAERMRDVLDAAGVPADPESTPDAAPRSNGVTAPSAVG